MALQNKLYKKRRSIHLYAKCYKWNRIFAVDPALDWLSACDWNTNTHTHHH